MSGATATAHFPSDQNRAALRQLRWRWLGTALIYTLFLCGGYWWLRSAESPHWATGWLLWAGLVMVLELGVLWWMLPNNRPPESPALLPTFGMGTTLTLICGLLLFLLAG